MRKELLAAALGFLIGAAALAGGQEDDGELQERLDELQTAMDRARLGALPGQEMPLRGAPHELRIYPVFDLTAGAPHFRPPAYAFDAGEGGPPADVKGLQRFDEMPEDEMRLPAGTIEEVLEMVRGSVWPASWDEEDAWMAATGQVLLVVNRRAVQEDISRFLDTKLRDGAHRCVTVEAQAVDLTRDLYRALAGGTSTALTPDQARTLAAALAARTARRVFDVRATGFAGQHFVAWHGRQLAVVTGAEAIVSKGIGAHDPRVEILRVGGFLAVRPSVGDDAGRITLDVDVRYDALESLATRAIGPVEVDEPRLHTCRARTSLTVPDRTWAIVGGGTPLDEGVRILLVRATYLPRLKGGAK